MLRQYLYICTIVKQVNCSKASKLSTCRAESGGCACADAAERVDAGAQFTCFTGTDVQILTLLLRSASMQCHVSFMQCHLSCIRHSTNTFVQLVKRQYLHFCTNTLQYTQVQTYKYLDAVSHFVHATRSQDEKRTPRTRPQSIYLLY